MIRARSIFVLAVVGLGCSSYGLASRTPPPIAPFGPSPVNMAQICVLRPHSTGVLLTTPVRDNGKLVGATKGPTYFCYFAEAGHHEIAVERGSLAGPLHTRIDVGPAERHYLHHSLSVVDEDLEWVSEPVAKELVQKCTYAVVVEVPSDDVAPGERPISRAQDPQR